MPPMRIEVIDHTDVAANHRHPRGVVLALVRFHLCRAAAEMMDHPHPDNIGSAWGKILWLPISRQNYLA